MRMMAEMAEMAERHLPVVEQTHATVVSEAGAYLDRRQLEVLRARLAEKLRTQRDSARSMREKAANDP